MRLIVVFLVSLSLLFNTSFANAIRIPNAENLFNEMDTGFLNDVDETMGEGLSAVLLLLYKIGYAVAVVVLMVLAVKLILASPAQKAEMKQGLIPYFVGALLLIAGVPIALKVLESFVKLFAPAG